MKGLDFKKKKKKKDEDPRQVKFEIYKIANFLQGAFNCALLNIALAWAIIRSQNFNVLYEPFPLFFT